MIAENSHPRIYLTKPVKIYNILAADILDEVRDDWACDYYGQPFLGEEFLDEVFLDTFNFWRVQKKGRANRRRKVVDDKLQSGNFGCGLEITICAIGMVGMSTQCRDKNWYHHYTFTNISSELNTFACNILSFLIDEPRTRRAAKKWFASNRGGFLSLKLFVLFQNQFTPLRDYQNINELIVRSAHIR